MEKRVQYKYLDSGVFRKDGAPGNDDNEPVTLGAGLWQCRLKITNKRMRVGYEVLHTESLRLKKKTRVKVKKEGNSYKIVEA